MGKQTCSAGRTSPVCVGLLSRAGHFSEANLSADASFEALEGAQAAAGNTIVGSDALGSRVNHGRSCLGSGAGGEAEVVKKVLALGGKLEEGPVKVDIAHAEDLHGVFVDLAVGAVWQGHLSGADGGAAPIASRVAIQVFEGGRGS